MQTIQAMQRRISTRKFTDRQITESDLQTLIRAALFAPVGLKKFEELQITVVQKKTLLQKIDETCRRVPDVSPCTARLPCF